MELIFTLEDIEQAAGELRKLVKSSSILAFHGQMGAGKTTFIKALCKTMQVSGVTGSPTFSIINAYDSALGTIYHMDLYRLKDEEEAIQAGVEDCLYSGNLCLVEWPEKAASLLPDDTVHLQLEIIDETTRCIRMVM